MIMTPEQCACGHLREEHLIITDKSCTECDCTQYTQAMPFTIKTAMDSAGNSRVIMEYGSSTLQLVPDAAVNIALNILSAAYAARGEQALFAYAKQHDLDIKELLKLER